MLRDLRYALRTLTRTPGYTATVILTLALGIGANTAIFSVIDAVLLRPTPLRNLDRLAMVWETDRNTGTTREPGSLPDFLDYRERAKQVDQLGALIATEVNLTPRDGAPLRLATLRVTPDLLPLLGMRPMAGRAFDANASRPGEPPALLISESLASRQFGSAASAVGRTLQINDRSGEVPVHLRLDKM